MSEQPTKYYISITGIELKSFWHLPKFSMYARRSMMQADRSPGIIEARGNYCGGVHHTLTVWKDRDSMLAYVRSGDHKEAMSISKEMGSFVKVCGYETTDIPPWDVARQIWEEKGKVVFDVR